MRAVVDADRAALGSALLVEVDADTVAAADDLAGIHTVAAQGVDRALADGVRRQFGDERGVHAVVRQRNSNVGLAAAKGEFEMVSLYEAFVIVRLQTDHKLAKGYDFHDFPSVKIGCAYFLPTRCTAKPQISSVR